MPKMPGGIKRFRRLFALVDVIERWGRLEKEKIDQLVSANLGVDIQMITKALYRDLQELVEMNILEVYYLTRDGRPIEDHDPDIHKNFLCEWEKKAG
jgi:hypothetical protein